MVTSRTERAEQRQRKNDPKKKRGRKGAGLSAKRKLYWVRRFQATNRTAEEIMTLVKEADGLTPSEKISRSSLFDWEKEEPAQLSEQRGAPPAISRQTMEEHVIPEVQALQQGKKSKGQKGKAQGAPNRFVLQAILQRSYRAALLNKGRTSLGRLLGPSALRTAVGRFRKLKGVVFKKRNVRSSARREQELQLRNYASFCAVFKSHAEDPDSDLRLNFHTFGMMDMLSVKVQHDAEKDAYAFTVGSESTVVFDEKLDQYIKIMLFHFCDGSIAEPVFLLCDRAIPRGKIIKISVPRLSPYALGIGHLWLVNPGDGGLKVFYGNFIQYIVLPSIQKQREVLALSSNPDAAKSSLALVAFDGEQSQLAAAQDHEIENARRQADVDFMKIDAGMSMLHSAPDVGRVHMIIHAFTKGLRNLKEKPFWWQPNQRMLLHMEAELKKQRKLFKPVTAAPKRRSSQSKYIHLEIIHNFECVRLLVVEYLVGCVF